MDTSRFRPYTYDPAAVDAYFDARQELTRVLLAVMHEGRPIGEVQLKHIDTEKKECPLGIHMRNDAVKGRCFGTEAERLAVAYTFGPLGMDTVPADTVLKNTRSQHVLEKVGFRFIREEGIFRYYRIDRDREA